MGPAGAVDAVPQAPAPLVVKAWPNPEIVQGRLAQSPADRKVPQPVAQIPAAAEIEAVLRALPMPASPGGEGEESTVEDASE